MTRDRGGSEVDAEEGRREDAAPSFGIALILAGVALGLAGLALWEPGTATVVVPCGAILLLAIGASWEVERRASPGRARVLLGALWVVSLALMGALVGFAMGVADRLDADGDRAGEVRDE